MEKSLYCLLPYPALVRVLSKTEKTQRFLVPPRYELWPIGRQEFSFQSKESTLLQAASPFYKTFAIECSRAQVSVDMFLFSSAYQDVASLGTRFHYKLNYF